jgi:hypothetical protein
VRRFKLLKPSHKEAARRPSTRLASKQLAATITLPELPSPGGMIDQDSSPVMFAVNGSIVEIH